jgi:acetate kinase
MGGPILVVNAGSSSIKFSAYGGDAAKSATLQLKGQVDGIGSAPHMAAYDADGMKINERHWLGVGGLDYEGILEALSGSAVRRMRR